MSSRVRLKTLSVIRNVNDDFRSHLSVETKSATNEVFLESAHVSTINNDQR